MTELTITPKIADKTARFKGAVAAGEHVAVTIKGGAEWIGTDGGANLTLRVLDLVTGRTLAVFPYWTEDNSEDWPDDVTSADAWAPATDDANDLYCELNLNTTRMVAAARHMLRVPVLFVLGDTDDPRTLYFRDRYEVEYWPERIGDTVPYDLDKWPKQIDEWAEQVAAWTTRLGAMKLSAVRTEAEGENPGKTTITLNDGTAQADTVVEILDGQVTPAQMTAAIAAMGATKQNTLTFDDIPTEDSDNPVKSGGVYGAVKEVSDAVTEHTGNTGIHVTATQKTAWTAKYAKPQSGIPKSDLSAGVQASLGKADTAVQVHQSLDAYVNAAGYDSDAKEIQLKHDSTVVARIDATEFIKDGMVDSVEITGGNLVISFNTDAGVEDIEIPLTNIFNPANYYDKTAADGRFVQKEVGKGLVAVDATLTTSGAAADAKAVGDALRGGFTEWEFSGSGYDSTKTYSVLISLSSLEGNYDYDLKVDGVYAETVYGTNECPTSIDFTTSSITATRHLITPTKTSQLQNDGDGTNAFVKTNDTRLSDARTPTAHAHAMADVTGLNVALAQKANASDLPYRLVTPGKWEFSGSGVQSGIEYVVEESFTAGEWNYALEGDGEPYIGAFVESPVRLTLVDFSVGGYDITATRASLPGHLCDRAGNRVVVTGDTTLTLPAANPGYLRDFLVRLEISGSTVPTITFAAPTGETITYETDGDEFPVPDEAGGWLYSFTESCVAHKFAVSLKKVNPVAAPQAQGGV